MYIYIYIYYYIDIYIYIERERDYALCQMCVNMLHEQHAVRFSVVTTIRNPNQGFERYKYYNMIW